MSFWQPLYKPFQNLPINVCRGRRGSDTCLLGDMNNWQPSYKPFQNVPINVCRPRRAGDTGLLLEMSYWQPSYQPFPKLPVNVCRGRRCSDSICRSSSRTGGPSQSQRLQCPCQTATCQTSLQKLSLGIANSHLDSGPNPAGPR